ncbi:MAG: hypothetical protein ACRYHQ_22845 [Janthinobacterium lividum]
MPSFFATRRAVPFPRHIKAITSRSFTPPVDFAHWLDLQAGVELAHGHIRAAETLSRRAAEMREART